MDTFEGNEEEPLSLQKYNFVRGDGGVNRSDPDGNYDLSDCGGAIAVASIVFGSMPSVGFAHSFGIALKMPPATQEAEMMVGLVWAEAEMHPENFGEKSAIAATVLNRAYYAGLSKWNKTSFGDGTIVGAIRTPGAFVAYIPNVATTSQWSKVMASGDRLRPFSELDKTLSNLADRIHFNDSVDAANLAGTSVQETIVGFGKLSGHVPVTFNMASNSPPSKRMRKIGREGQTFYEFVPGREVQ